VLATTNVTLEYGFYYVGLFTPSDYSTTMRLVS